MTPDREKIDDHIKFGTVEFTPYLNSRKALEKTLEFDIVPRIPDLNVVKFGGQSIIDRGRGVVFPLIDELKRAREIYSKIILCAGGGTRARHAFGIALDVGAGAGLIGALGIFVPRQNARMLQWLLADIGGIFIESNELDFEKIQLYTKIGCIPVVVGMPPHSYWEKPRAEGRIPANRTDSGTYLIAEFFGARTCIFVKDEEGLYTADPKKDKNAKFISRIGAQELLDMNLKDLPVEHIVLKNMINAKSCKEIRIINGLVPGNLMKALNKEDVGTVIYQD